ncbi:hypothetical protein ACEWY4_002476 [Coilia grayii]|uniref:GTPase IMAP family member 8 n=1 Tax=Coilia grayii TaxID=363190 RepID=A0ABD1KNJ1_9TELE
MKLSRVTQFCEKRTKDINGRPVAVIDTPGLFETRRSEKEVIREILQSVSLYRPGPHVFVVVIPLGRLTLEDKGTNSLIESTFGRRVWDFTIVLFTHGDQLEGKTLNDVIASGDEELREFIRRCSGGFLVFNNKDMGDREQVAKLLEKVETLVALNGNQCYRSHLYPKQERRIRERQERILAERDKDIARKEKTLEEHYDGEELERRRRELWRKEEMEARKMSQVLPMKTQVGIIIVISLVATAIFGPVGMLTGIFLLMITVFARVLSAVLHCLDSFSVHHQMFTHRHTPTSAIDQPTSHKASSHTSNWTFLLFNKLELCNIYFISPSGRHVSGAEMEEWRIMLLGRRGVGKSSTGNTILRQIAFPVNMSLGRITQFCDRKNGTVDGRPVAVIDTPGLKNGKGDEKKVIREILKNISLYKPGPHVFLIVLPIGNLTQDDIRVHKIIEGMFGKKVWRYAVLLFTHGDSLDGNAQNDVISGADKELRKLIRKCTGGFVVFNNKDMANRAQVTLLMERIETMLAVNGNTFYPTKFYPRCERKIRERQEKHMEERAEDIAQRERQVEDLYSGDELEEKRLELLRSIDEELRTLAENPPKFKKH